MSPARHLNPQVRGPGGRVGAGVPRATPPQRGRGVLWTPEDEAYLLRHYAARGPAWTAARLGRSRRAAVHKAMVLRRGGADLPKLHSRSGVIAQRNSWSPIEMARAARLWGAGWPTAAIARSVGRSEDAVKARAYAEGWERPDYLDTGDVAAILGRSPGTIVRWIAAGWLPSVAAQTPRAKCGRAVRPADLRAFLADVRNIALWSVAEVRADWRPDAAIVRPRYLTKAQALKAGVAYSYSGLTKAAREGRVPALRVRGQSGSNYALPFEVVIRLGGRP